MSHCWMGSVWSLGGSAQSLVQTGAGALPSESAVSLQNILVFKENFTGNLP